MTDIKKEYYLGGYYLTMLRPKEFGTDKKAIIYTCSECINVNLVDTWSYSWTTDNNKGAIEAMNALQISDVKVNTIRSWIDMKFNEGKIGFLNVFFDIETALEYKNKFFSHLSEIKLLALYFDENERADILDRFKPETAQMGEIGLRLTLLNGIKETENEKSVGFDYIGIEIGGSFHTFHCHDIGKELCQKFGLTLNRYGLFDSDMNSDKVLSYLNNEDNGCEPVPWFIAKTKLATTE